MDSTIFIRRRRVLTLWLMVPLLAVAAAEFGSRAFCSYEEVSCLRAQALNRLIPEMIAEETRFDQFINSYQINTADASSVENTYIELLNTAADKADFNITSIHMAQVQGDKPGTIKIEANVSGIGSCRNIVAFLQNSKKQDPLLYEDQIALTRSANDPAVLQLEAKLGKIYITGEKTP